MDMYIVGNPAHSMTPDTEMYPLRLVKMISKEDLIRASREEVFIINVSSKTIFNPDKNIWEDIPDSDKYSPWTEGK